MLERTTLVRDLVDSQGRLLARRGTEISARAVAEVAARAQPLPGRPLATSVVAEDLPQTMAEPVFKHLFRLRTAQSEVAAAVLATELPEPLHEELRHLRQDDWSRYRHAVATAAVATRMVHSALGDAAAIPGLVAAALLHDLGMRHVPAELLRSRRPLDASGLREVAAHPLLGAWHLATVLGRHPAVEAALGHHWRQGHGYPRLEVAPPRSVDVVAVASAFVALTHPRPFRTAVYDARSAVDLLVADAAAGEADLDSVKLLVHALRGAHGQVREVRFGRQRLEQGAGLAPHPALAQRLAQA